EPAADLIELVERLVDDVDLAALVARMDDLDLEAELVGDIAFECGRIRILAGRGMAAGRPARRSRPRRRLPRQHFGFPRAQSLGDDFAGDLLGARNADQRPRLSGVELAFLDKRANR